MVDNKEKSLVNLDTTHSKKFSGHKQLIPIKPDWVKECVVWFGS